MASIVIGEQPRRRFSIKNTLERTYEREILVQTDHPLRGPLEASIACGVSFGDSYQTQATPSGEYEYDTGAEAIEFSAEEHDPDIFNLWRIRIFYSSHGLDPSYYTAGGGANINTQGGGAQSGGQDGQNESPLAEPAKIVWGKQSRLVAIPASHNVPPSVLFGNRFVTTANEPFSKVPEIDYGTLTLTITRNEADFDAVDREQYWMNTNEWPFYGFLANSVLCTSITGSRDYRNKITFWVVSYQFLLDSTGNSHKWRATNKGTKYLTSPSVLSTQKDASTAIGRPKEVFLKLDGTLLADGDPPVVLDFDIYPEIDFNPLGLE